MVKQIWKKKKLVDLCFMDTKKAFNYILKEQLLKQIIKPKIKKILEFKQIFFYIIKRYKWLLTNKKIKKLWFNLKFYKLFYHCLSYFNIYW